MRFDIKKRRIWKNSDYFAFQQINWLDIYSSKFVSRTKYVFLAALKAARAIAGAQKRSNLIPVEQVFR